MQLNMANPTGPRGLDPNLPFIAAYAAAEFDDLIGERESSLENIKKLLGLLNEAFPHSIVNNNSGEFKLDPLGADVFSRAINESHHMNLNSYQEVLARAEELAVQLGGVVEKDAPIELPLEKLKAFCVALSKFALSTRQQASRSRAKNPGVR